MTFTIRAQKCIIFTTFLGSSPPAGGGRALNNMYVVYAIHNRNNNKIYIGQTKDLETRLRLHEEKLFKGFTARFDGEWKLIYKEHVVDRKIALKRERQLKSYRGRQFIKTYIPR